MRKASSLFSNTATSKILSRNRITTLFSDLVPQNPLPISPPHFNPRSKSHSLLPHSSPNPHPNPFPICPYLRPIQTLASISPPLPPPNPEVEDKPDIEEALESATTTEQILTVFEAHESSLDSNDNKLGLACLKVGEHLDFTGSNDLEKTLILALRALKNLERDGGGSISVAKALRLVGSISCKLKRFEDSLESLNTADQILGRFEKEGFGASDIRSVSLAVQLQLADTKTAMGRRWEALVNLRRSLELKILILEPNCLELGATYKDLAEAYTVVMDFKEALPLCLKALEILEAQLEHNSVEVARAQQLLGIIYMGFGENEKALEQNMLSLKILKNLRLEAELLHVEIEVANIKIAMGRLGEAIDTLKGVIQRADKESEIRALVFVSMAKGLLNQEKFGESRRCLEISCGILDKMILVSLEKVAEAYAEISLLYEMMNEFETAIYLMKRTLAILEKLPREQHLEGSISARMGWLLLLTGRVPQAIPYLESAIERLKGSFGPKHFGLGFVHKHLGQAYLEMDKPQLAAQMLVLAKDIIDVTFGPDHEDSIDVSQCLANTYGAMGSYARAMEFQQRVIDGRESHGPDARDELREAHRLLEQLKKKAQGSPSAVFPANTLPLPQGK